MLTIGIITDRNFIHRTVYRDIPIAYGFIAGSVYCFDAGHDSVFSSICQLADSTVSSDLFQLIDRLRMFYIPGVFELDEHAKLLDIDTTAHTAHLIELDTNRYLDLATTVASQER